MQHDDLDLALVDTDGAIRETAERAGFTRRRAIAGGVAGSLAVSGGLFGLTSSAEAQTAASDVDILNFALTLEYLEAAFYAQAAASGALSGGQLRLAQVAGAHEAAHVKALQAALGSAAIASPAFDFKGTTSDPAKFIATSLVLEETGVAAYKGQAPLVKSKAVLASALAIHSVEAKHATWARILVNQLEPLTLIPGPADAPLTKAQVLRAVGETGFIVS